MDTVKNNYQKVVAIVILSATIAGLIVYRYYFSRQVDDRCETRCEQRLAIESDIRSSLENDTKIQSTLKEAISTLRPEIRSADKKSTQLMKKPQKAIDDQKSTDEIDVEFSPAKSPASNVDFRSGDDDMQILKAASLEAHRKGQLTISSAASPPFREESPVNVYYCNCDQILNSSSIIEEESNENIRVKLIPTKIMPIRYDRFIPVNLTEYKGYLAYRAFIHQYRRHRNGDVLIFIGTGNMSENSLNGPNYPTNHRLIVPFLPNLHTIAYASKHIELINQLIENYQYYEPNYDD